MMRAVGRLVKITLGIGVIVIVSNFVDAHLGIGIGIAAGLGFIFGDFMSESPDDARRP